MRKTTIPNDKSGSNANIVHPKVEYHSKRPEGKKDKVMGGREPHSWQICVSTTTLLPKWRILRQLSTSRFCIPVGAKGREAGLEQVRAT